MKNRSKEYIFPVFTFLLGLIWVIFSVKKYGLYDGGVPQIGFFPFFVGILLMIISALTIPSSLKAKASNVSFLNFLPIVGLIGIILLGFLIGTFPAIFLFFIIWLKVFEKYNWKITLLTTVIVTIVIWAVFSFWIGINFDRGIIGNMLYQAL